MEILFGRNQLPVVISFLVCGCLCGAVYDILKIKRRILGDFALILFFDDLIFSAVCTIVVIFNAFAFNDGNMKWYELPFFVAGFCVYRLTLSKIFIRACFFIIDICKKMLKKLFSPIKRLILYLFEKIKFIFERIVLHIFIFSAQRKFMELIKGM